MHPIARSLLVCLAALALAAPAVAQEDEATKTTISAIERGESEAMVYLEGAAIYREDEDEYVFSDGTGSIAIDTDEVDGDEALPLFELIGIEGTLEADEIEVSGWTLLPIMTPAVIVEEPQVIESFWGWIVAYGSQAPEPSE
jgi:uncharacterized protein YdeI (BOF family)